MLTVPCIVQGPLTYETLFSKLSLLTGSGENEDYGGVESLQFLLIEAKTNQPNVGSIDGSGGEAEIVDGDEEEKSEGNPGPFADHDTNSDSSEAGDEREDGSKEQGQGESGWQGREEGDEYSEERKEEGENVEHGEPVGRENGVPSTSLSILEKSLPQIVSECVALWVLFITICGFNLSMRFTT